MMAPFSDEVRGSKALANLTDLVRRSVQLATPAQLEQGLHSLSTGIAVRRARRRRLVCWSLLGTVAAVSVVGGLSIVSRSSTPLPMPASPELAYRIEGGKVIDGGYLHESGNAGIKMLFAEGTEFILAPGARGRLRTIDKLGARIAIEQGTASFQITPRNSARWLVDVGPFLVKVRGTVFTVSWDAPRERFELRLRHGRVTVTGPVSENEIALRAGQRLVINLPKAEISITELKSEATWPDSASPTTQTTDSPQERPSATPERRVGRIATLAAPPSAVGKIDGEHRWAVALAAGNLDGILADVDRVGVKSTLEKASSEDLFVLADAARYRRRTDLARDALLAERRRFPRSSRAVDAVFLLGQVEESSEHGSGRAIGWYDEYLDQAPAGTYASEALGRKMILTRKTKGDAQARPLAEEYLRRYPSGSYAGSARVLSRTP
jgi:TolA-binding protein